MTLIAPANPAGPTPLRRPNSVRRTSTIDTSWPQGQGGPMRMGGRTRDLSTSATGQVRVLAEDWIEVLVSPLREILEIRASRLDDDVQGLVGARAGGQLRKEIARVLPAEQATGTALHLLLDDLAGASLVAGWAWTRWAPEGNGPSAKGPILTAGRNGVMTGVCMGFRPGSSALAPDGGPNRHLQSCAATPPLVNPEDPSGWHEVAEQTGTGARRARCLDVWLDDRLRMEVVFQDSATSPDGGWRLAVHEYRVSASADPATSELLQVEVDPRVLPYGECPSASPNAALLVGRRLPEFRRAVLETLPGTLGCTHLNDVLRSLADAPGLAARTGV